MVTMTTYDVDIRHSATASRVQNWVKMWPWLRFHGLRHEALRGVPISDENVSFQNVTLFPENGWFTEFSTQFAAYCQWGSNVCSEKTTWPTTATFGGDSATKLG